MGVEPERAVSFSSGGFSDIFPIPDYQKSAVTTYLNSIGDTFKGLYNSSGRGFPDVAAQGRNFNVYSQGQLIKVGGTSASAPTFASIISLLNNARIKSGQKPLGFLNPWLYSDAVNGGLTDIKLGGSKGCTGTDSKLNLCFTLYAGSQSEAMLYLNIKLTYCSLQWLAGAVCPGSWMECY